MAKTPFFSSNRGRVIVVLVVCSIVAALAFKRFLPGVRPFQHRLLDQRPYGPRSGPEIQKSWEDEMRRESARYSDAHLQQMVDLLFVQNDPDRANFRGLLYAGARPLPFLLMALDDPRTSTMVFTGEVTPITDTSPFERICALLRNLRPAEAAKPVARYLDHPNSAFRQSAALLLATIGTQECTDPVKRALADKDQRIREYVLIGLTSEQKGRQSDKQFLSDVFPALLPLLKEGKFTPESPASAMMAVDASKAVPILESPQYLSVTNPQLTEVLGALDRPGVKVPRATLLELLAKLEPAATKGSSAGWAYAGALSLYANNPDRHAESKFRSLINSPNSEIASAAAQGMETLDGINVHNAVWAVYDRHGFDAMTQPQQFCFAVELYRDEVNNGGHEQYFYNDDSDLYKTAIEGLRAMGASAQADILSNASLAFTPSGPASDNEERRRQMDEMGGLRTDKHVLFDAADQRFYHLEEEPGKRLDVLMTLYALKHRSDFTVALSSDKEDGSDSPASDGRK